MQKKTGHLISLGILLIVISIGGNGLAAAPQRCDPTQQMQTDLSGTYAGSVIYPDGGLFGDGAILTITGNQFTLDSAGKTPHSGRITAVTTCNYTAATMMFGESTPTQMAKTISVRAQKTGNNLHLKNVPGEKRTFSFGATPRRTRR